MTSPISDEKNKTIILTKFIIFFNKNNLYYGSQYGFRGKYSIELAATEVIERVIEIFNLFFYADDTALMSTRNPFNSQGKIL